jgi:DNA-binding Lrp family transcriptional regulator
MVEESKLEYSVLGFIMVVASPGRDIEVYEALRKFQYKNTRVNGINAVFGDVDLVVEISAKDHQVLSDCVTKGIRNIPGIADTKTLYGLCLDKSGTKP